MRQSYIIALLLILTACIEPISFETGSEPRRLVVDGFISNISFAEQSLKPAPPRRFYVAVRWSSEVDNVLDEVISDASVTLISSEGESFGYFWDEGEQRYLIRDASFHAEENVDYKVRVVSSDGKVYESDTDKLHPAPEIQEIDVDYKTILKSISVGNQTEIVEQRGIQVSVPLEAHGGDEYHYRWKIVPSWIFETSLLEDGHPNKRCYVTNLYEYQSISVWEDKAGGYNRDLFFLETDDNEQVQYGYSTLITQYSLSPEGYEFWDQLATQQQSGGGIFDPPPFSLITNIHNVNDPEEAVSGFFYVAHESSYRWKLNPEDLPYQLTFMDACEPMPGVPFIPPPGCMNCLDYRGTHTDNTNQQPIWWDEY
ncbi:protein of unknown function [Algoriphagus locisalis]|uniref:DUF4249 domain-containing protein n=1 Tax=Algoriphagus locisalis TaxID=305507 RepID=A0A1I7BVB9_9BACT|nr:DUF4249 domain-containing protein [Algoriphagus locisalis]SFT91113.1 protein of unknown function [Algoriphagus locisalis]